LEEDPNGVSKSGARSSKYTSTFAFNVGEKTQSNRLFAWNVAEEECLPDAAREREKREDSAGKVQS